MKHPENVGPTYSQKIHLAHQLLRARSHAVRTQVDGSLVYSVGTILGANKSKHMVYLTDAGIFSVEKYTKRGWSIPVLRIAGIDNVIEFLMRAESETDFVAAIDAEITIRKALEIGEENDVQQE